MITDHSLTRFRFLLPLFLCLFGVCCVCDWNSPFTFPFARCTVYCCFFGIVCLVLSIILCNPYLFLYIVCCSSSTCLRINFWIYLLDFLFSVCVGVGDACGINSYSSWKGSLGFERFYSAFRLLHLAQSTGYTGILLDWGAADPTVQILLIYKVLEKLELQRLKEDSKFATKRFYNWSGTVASF